MDTQTDDQTQGLGTYDGETQQTAETFMTLLARVRHYASDDTTIGIEVQEASPTLLSSSFVIALSSAGSVWLSCQQQLFIQGFTCCL